MTAILPDRKFGRVRIVDRRDAKHLIGAAASHRRRRYWNCSWCGDQGSSPSCVGYAWGHWLAVTPRPTYIDCDGVYGLCLYLDEWDGEEDEGTSVRAGAKLMNRVGILREYRWARTKDALIYALLEEGPIVAGTEWQANMDEPGSGNVIAIGGENYGGHAYLVDGVNIDTGLARIKCAWWVDGKPWGENGRVFIDIDNLWRLIKDGGEACLGVKANVRKLA
jgi:hypothetical protein